MPTQSPEGAVAAAVDGVIYVVDDDDEICASLTWLFGSVGLRTQAFSSGPEFLAWLDAPREEPDGPSCLITDMRMPGMSGLRLQNALRQRGNAIPIIFVSAHGSIKLSVEALRAGAVSFLEKPYDPEHLVDLAQQTLEAANEQQRRRAHRERLLGTLTTLTPREGEVLGYVLRGEPSKVIASALGISARTVDVHRTRIKEKTGMASVTHLLRELFRAGIDSGQALVNFTPPPDGGAATPTARDNARHGHGAAFTNAC